jgi:non-heme chloroperoxidase
MNENPHSSADTSRRNVLLGGLIATVATGWPAAALAQMNSRQDTLSSPPSKGTETMSTITTKDGTEIYYKDWGPKSAQPIVFHHGWPLSGDDWDTQMLYLLDKGYRVIAHDRRGHGRSAQVSDGHDMDHYAADIAAVVEHLDLRNAVHIGHSTGGGEATRYVAQHGQRQGRVAKLVLIGAVPPVMVKTPSNPGGLPIEVFDGLRKTLADNRAQFYLDFPSGPFYGFNRPGAKPIPGVIQNWWRQGMMGSAKAHHDGIKAFSETDFTEDLKIISVPTLVMHGDDDQIVPIADSALLSSKLLKKATLKVYKGFPHGMCTTHADTVNEDLLAFVANS